MIETDGLAEYAVACQRLSMMVGAYVAAADLYARALVDTARQLHAGGNAAAARVAEADARRALGATRRVVDRLSDRLPLLVEGLRDAWQKRIEVEGPMVRALVQREAAQVMAAWRLAIVPTLAAGPAAAIVALPDLTPSNN